MRSIGTFALATAFGAFALAAPLSALAGQITVTGEGRVQAAPDMATITLGVTTQGPTAAEAMAANSAELAKVMDRLTASGVAARDMQTTGLSLYPEWRPSADGQSQQIGGYTASNTLTLRIRALDTLGGVLDSAIQDGANTLNGVEFGLATPRPAEDEARKLAVADARARAELLAAAAGVELGGISTITEAGAMSDPRPMMRMSADAAGAPPVAGGEIATIASVTITWDIKE